MSYEPPIFKYCFAVELDKTEIVFCLEKVFGKLRMKISVGKYSFTVTLNKVCYHFDIGENYYTIFIAYRTVYLKESYYLKLMDTWLQKLVVAINGSDVVESLAEPVKMKRIFNVSVASESWRQTKKEEKRLERKRVLEETERLTKAAGNQAELRLSPKQKLLGG